MVYDGLKRNKRFFWILLVVSFCLFTVCKKTDRVSERDFPEIKEEGELRVLTLSGSMTYFMYKGEPKGYEYELLRDFADSHQLKLQIKLAENETKLTQMLLNGEGDVIACNIPITNEGKENLLYCGSKSINRQVLIQCANRGTLLRDVTDLIGKEIFVIHDSKYYHRLNHLNNELGGGIHIRTIDKDTISVEDLIEMVSKGEITYTVSDWDMAKLNKTYFHNLNINLTISHPQPSSWAVKQSTPALAAAIDTWFEETQNTPRYKGIIKRYFEMSKMPGDEPAPLMSPTQISPYDVFFKKQASVIHWDWRLLASIAFQESKFYTDRVSWAGATGLMGLMPRTAEIFGLSSDSLIYPESSIRTAVLLIKRLNRSFSSVQDENERIKFILAAYNAGSGHIYDAQALAKTHGKNPAVWSDNVEEYLKLKSLPEYYNDPVCKQGYFRAAETVNYVQAVLERWEYYKMKVMK
ncbi:MAG: transporter substrate-binding domain-containing protein [Candidatus Symbiothrix sp.]|jgi:membrane-bound lytic murein transglycosylase F|nr:transporter substrate-binding domain-containing protein [Candidatus Symbiothrix sp.]